jgi:hypothetical protein
VRILITVSPRMYREALALAVHSNRPGLEVRIAPPTEGEAEVVNFRPHLLVHDDNDGMDQRLLSDLPCRVEVLYTDSMNAKIAVDGSVSEVSDISIDDLTGVLKEAERLISEA